jgi:hypothetical protein
MSDPNSTSPDILSDGPVKDILRPVVIAVLLQGRYFEFRLSGLEISKYYNNISSTITNNQYNFVNYEQ